MPKYKNEVSRYISEQINIVDLIGSSVNLKRAGRNYVGLCPFHNEKTPSFSVSFDKQIFKCFGCGESGDAITFAMKDRGLTFIEAIEWLSDRYHIDLSDYIVQGDSNAKGVDTKLLYEIMRESAKFYFKKLFEHRNAQKYLIARDLSKETVYEFGIGYAPDAWSELYEFLKKKGFKEEDMMLCGLIKTNKKGGYYDNFRNRIIFPIFDNRGRVCAFGGRVLDNGLPKYLNSPETPIFNKSKILYGLNFVNKNYKGDQLILVEGYMDLIALNQHGIKNVVATLGTALNGEHIKLMKRNFNDIIFSFDGDKAGRTAIYKSLNEFDRSGLRVKVLELLDAKDPDEFIKKKGKEAFLHQVEHASGEIDFKIRFIKSDFDLENSFDRLEFLNRIYTLIDDLDSDAEKEIYLERLSKLVRLDFEAVKRDYKNAVLHLKKKTEYESVQLSSENSDPRCSEEYGEDFIELSESFYDEMPAISEKSVQENLSERHVKIKHIKEMKPYFSVLESQNALLAPNSNLDKVEKLLIRNAISDITTFRRISESDLKFILYENLLAFTLLEIYYESFDELRLSNLVSIFDLEEVELLKRISAIEIPLSENLPATLLRRHAFFKLELDLYHLDVEIRELQLELDVEAGVKLRMKLAQKVEMSKKLLELRKNLNEQI